VSTYKIITFYEDYDIKFYTKVFCIYANDRYKNLKIAILKNYVILGILKNYLVLVRFSSFKLKKKPFVVFLV
jgi:hypothetical protein